MKRLCQTNGLITSSALNLTIPAQGIGVEWNIVKEVGALWCRSSCPVKSREGIIQSHSRIRHKSARLICDRSFKCADLDLRSGCTRLDQEDDNQTQQDDGTTHRSRRHTVDDHRIAGAILV